MIFIPVPKSAFSFRLRNDTIVIYTVPASRVLAYLRVMPASFSYPSTARSLPSFESLIHETDHGAQNKSYKLLLPTPNPRLTSMSRTPSVRLCSFRFSPVCFHFNSRSFSFDTMSFPNHPSLFCSLSPSRTLFTSTLPSLPWHISRFPSCLPSFLSLSFIALNRAPSSYSNE